MGQDDKMIHGYAKFSGDIDIKIRGVLIRLSMSGESFRYTDHLVILSFFLMNIIGKGFINKKIAHLYQFAQYQPVKMYFLSPKFLFLDFF